MRIPDTALTATLRTLWACTDGGTTWEDWYAEKCQGGSVNGRRIATAIFTRARRYWPDYFTPEDLPAVAVWADLFDGYCPLVTPEVIEQAVDDVHLLGVTEPLPANFLRAAERIMEAHRGA